MVKIAITTTIFASLTLSGFGVLGVASWTITAYCGLTKAGI